MASLKPCHATDMVSMYTSTITGVKTMNELTSTFFSISTDISQPVRPDLSEQITLFTISTILAGLIIRLAISLAHTYGILDRPGSTNSTSTSPFVGGTGIFAALLIALCF